MKSMLCWAGLFCAMTVVSVEWENSYWSAREKAIRQNKKMMIFFSGSDWCPEGQALKRELLDSRNFSRLCGSKYIFYNADFPKYKRLGQSIEERNRHLASRYGIHMFPAIVVINPRGGGLIVKQTGITEKSSVDLLKKLDLLPAKKKDGK